MARATPGLTGADLANLVNLAAIKAATRNLPGVTQRLLEEAFDDVLMGSERKSVVLTEDSRRLTAYHEGGHALVSIYTPGSEPIRKITIVPRGQSLGMVASMPARDETSYNRQQMMARLAVALGGRAAEHLIFGEDKVTSGTTDALAPTHTGACLLVPFTDRRTLQAPRRTSSRRPCLHRAW